MVSRINEDDAYVDILKPDAMDKHPQEQKSKKKSDLVREQR